MREVQVYGVGEAYVDHVISLGQSQLPASVLPSLSNSHSISPDLVQQVLAAVAKESLAVHPGGSLANSLAAYSQLGGKAVLSAKLGDDSCGTFFAQQCESVGLELEGGRVGGAATGTVLVFVQSDGARSFVVSQGVNVEFSLQDVHAKRIQESEWLVIEGFLLGAGHNTPLAVKHACELARDGGTSVALTLSNEHVVRRNRRLIHEILPGCKLVVANHLEAQALTEAYDNEAAFQALTRLCPNVVMTAGETGSVVRYNDQTLRVEAMSPQRIVDTNGAGDIYCGAFLFGIVRQMELGQVVNMATTLATKLIQRAGPRLDSHEFDLTSLSLHPSNLRS